MTPSPFDRFGPMIPAGPVVLSVPHAGRDYPAALLQVLAAPLALARSLEDRHVDAVALAAAGVGAGVGTAAEVMLIQRRARAWIDLNRREDERDPAVDEGAPRLSEGRQGPDGAKLRSGLGLVPRRGARGELWRRRWTDAEITERIAADHRPYHQALAEALAAAQARYGTAVLVDLHSMPPLTGRQPASVVIGDRQGASADERLACIAERVVADAGLRAVRNRPYAGGHIVERHGRPAEGVHAIQIELDRALYLDAALDRPVAAEVARTAALIRTVLDALSRAARSGGLSHVPLAAE